MNESFDQLERMTKKEQNKNKKDLKRKNWIWGISVFGKSANQPRKKMQDYLGEGDRNIMVSKTIYKARGMTLDIKSGNKTTLSVTIPGQWGFGAHVY